mmetsp:Transcript_8460/g.24327  ORF Transcript_8460/g.24327 Transcript_8460/m.24327 type:complete len:344 (-) Transcript_8460:468-1499(-)
MLEAGIIVPIDGTAEFTVPPPAPVRRRRRAAGAEGGDAEGDALEGDEPDAEDGVMSELGEDEVLALREENRQLRESLRQALAEVERLKAHTAHLDGSACEELGWQEQLLPLSDAHEQPVAIGVQAAVPSQQGHIQPPAGPRPSQPPGVHAVAQPPAPAAGIHAVAALGPMVYRPSGSVSLPCSFGVVPPQGSGQCIVPPQGGQGGARGPAPTSPGGVALPAGVWGRPAPSSFVGSPRGQAVYRQVSQPGCLPSMALPLQLLADGAAVSGPGRAGIVKVGTTSTATLSPRTPEMPSSPEAEFVVSPGAPLLLSKMRSLAAPTKPMEPVAAPPQFVHMAGAPPAA